MGLAPLTQEAAPPAHFTFDKAPLRTKCQTFEAAELQRGSPSRRASKSGLFLRLTRLLFIDHAGCPRTVLDSLRPP